MICKDHDDEMVKKFCDNCKTTKTTSIKNTIQLKYKRYLCSTCIDWNTQKKVKCQSSRCNNSAAWLSLYETFDYFNMNNEKYTCVTCTLYLDTLINYNSQLGDQMFFSGKKCPSGKEDAPIYKKVKTYKEAFKIADEDEVDEIKAWYDKMKNYMDQQELVIQRPLLCCKCDTQIKKGKKM